ncbi:hypothetical protein [Ideonella livida]|uniref:Uncharacterized protein n=1 Tax=Ideonella livida TaxID=2707176 RepID=A0A7C9PEQ5_9BURK|nr:hypothetical protein [Ideonella livida]NDY89731.1 hypothetical protein [Ideonella livida]
MLVDPVVTIVSAAGQFRSPDDWPRPTPTTDFELGGQAISDSSAGHEVRVWRAWLAGDSVMCAPEDDIAEATALFSRPGIWHIGLAFDQLMRPCVTFMDRAGAWLWWYDPLESSMVFLPIPGATSPRISLDDKRAEFISGSDVVLAYVRDGWLCVRLQRERYSNENRIYLLPAGVSRLDRIGMSLACRMQYKLSS